AVALADAEVFQCGGEGRNLIRELGVSVASFRVRDRAVVDESLLLAAAALDVAIEAIVCGVALCARQPAAIFVHVGIEDPIPELVPADVSRCLSPEGFGVLLPAGVDLMISAHFSFTPH